MDENLEILVTQMVNTGLSECVLVVAYDKHFAGMPLLNKLASLPNPKQAWYNCKSAQ